jgi:hypothetical protein
VEDLYGFEYTYDAEGNRVRKFEDNNNDGIWNGGDTEIAAYFWDHRNRLTGSADIEQYAGTWTLFVEYLYDVDNQLIRRRVDPDGGAGNELQQQTFFIWEDGQIVLQYDQIGTGWLNDEDISHRYLWGPHTNELLVDEVVH